MSTYTDMHCRVRENITVDSRYRDTNQKVRFANEENEYWGTFHGRMLTSDAVLSDVVIIDSTLSSTTGKASVDDVIKSATNANRAYLKTTGLALEQLEYLSLANMFAQGTKKGHDYELKSNEVWRVNSALKEDYYEVEGMKFKLGDIFIVKNDVLIADVTPSDLELVAFGDQGTKEDIDDISAKLEQLSSALLSSDGIVDQLSCAISAIVDEALPLSVMALKQELAVSLSSEDGAGDVLKTYVLSQGGVEVGRVNIPKDKVVEAAGLVLYDGEADTFEIRGKPFPVPVDAEGKKPAKGEYIVMVTTVSETQIWVPVTDLVKDCDGGETATISVNVEFDIDQNKNVITATVKTGSISRGLLSADVTSELGGLHDGIEQVSADLSAEVARADDAEQCLSAMIDGEIAERIADVNYLSGQIDTAVQAAETAIQKLNEDIASEADRAQQAEKDLSGLVEAEAKARAEADETLAIALENEQSRAEASEETLSGMFEAEVARALTAEADLAQAIEDLSTYADSQFETKEDANTKYNELTGKIAAEETARKQADIEFEASAALSVEGLSTTVDKWLTDSSEKYVKTSLTGDNKIATIADVVGLSGVIHFRGIAPTVPADAKNEKPDTDWYVEEGNDPTQGDIIIVGTKEYMFTGVFKSDSSKWNLLGDEGTYATKQELSDEAIRAQQAEKDLSGLVEAEEIRASAVEVELSNKLSDFCTYAEVERDYVSKQLVKSCLSDVFDSTQFTAVKIGSVVQALSSLFEAVKS